MFQEELEGQKEGINKKNNNKKKYK